MPHADYHRVGWDDPALREETLMADALMAAAEEDESPGFTGTSGQTSPVAVLASLAFLLTCAVIGAFTAGVLVKALVWAFSTGWTLID